MDDKKYLLKHLALALNVGIVLINEGDVTCCMEPEDEHPLVSSGLLQERLIEGAKKQKHPYIYQDEHKVYFACIRQDKTFALVGPMCNGSFTRTELHRFYRSYGVAAQNERGLKHFRLSEILDVVEILSNILIGAEYADELLMTENHLTQNIGHQEELEHVLFNIKAEEEELYHHTYQEERKLLDSVRDGRMKDALRLTRNMDADLGKLSVKAINHWKNAAVVGITLCTRAAIEGGVSPSAAYRLSDFYIQKCDECNGAAELLENRNRAIEQLIKKVQENKNRKTSNYTERCKDYVSKHYREKIYLDGIARTLGLSESYLSRLFRKETGIRFQDYINQVKLEHAANLLRYSEESIAHIAEYVNYPSQSYFGKIFKQKYHMTPKQYRKRNKSVEYFETK